MPGLKALQLGHTGITDAGLAKLTDATAIETLDLGSTQITDAGLAHLSGLQNLRMLSLFRTNITDAGLKHFGDLKNLRSITLNGTSVTEQGVRELQEVLPSCNIQWDARMSRPSIASLPGQPRRAASAQPSESGVQKIRSDADLEKLVARASEIRSISVFNGMLTTKGANRLKEFPELRLLFLRDSFIDDSVYEAISDLPNLSSLFIAGSRVGDSGLLHVAKLPKLQQLELSQTAVTPDGLLVLENAPSLRELNLMGRQFDDKSLENLKVVRSLRELSIHGGSISDEGLKHLCDFPVLETFAVSCQELPGQASQITDKGMESIAKTKISRLFIARVAITDAGLKHLESMTTLRSLTLKDTDVTTEGLEALQKALPALRVR